jgi:HAE1 family hydrophobic/amphiphilic exporter-1
MRTVVAMHTEVKASNVTSAGGMSSMMGGGGKPLTIEVRGDDLGRMAEVAVEVRKIMASVKGTGDVTADLFEERPELAYTVDYEKAARAGLAPAQLGNTLRTALYGTTISRFRGMGRDDDITLRLQEPDRRDTVALGQVRVRSSAGQLVELQDLGHFGEGVTPVKVVRKDKQRSIAVGASVTGRALGDVYKDVEEKLHAAGLYSRTDVSLVTSGTVKEQQTLYGNVGLMLVLALLLVFLVMAAQFESFMDPFVVMFSLPFAFTGAFGLLWATGTHLSVPALLGLLVLVGVVVKNAIVFVDYANLMRRKHGMDLEEALTTAAERRLRPVLMTSLATVAGLLPMALARGEGSEMWAPLGRAALGGMLFSTVITLVIVPVMYHIFEFARRKRVIDVEVG